jgi:hypothetical protein
MPAQLPDVIIGVDPGGTTGIAWWVRKTGEIGTDQIEDCHLDTQLASVIHRLSYLTGLAVPFVRKNQVHVVPERFEFRLDERDRTKIDYTAPEVNGAIRYWSHDRDHVYRYMQGAAKAKAFWTDDKIKTLNLWVRGRRHGMDALRHVLAYRTFVLGDKALFDHFRPTSTSADV